MMNDSTTLRPSAQFCCPEPHLQAMLDRSSDGAEILDLQGNRLWINSTGKTLLESSEFPGDNDSQWLQFWNSPAYPEVRTAFHAALNLEMGKFSVPWPTPTPGHHRWEGSVFALRATDGSPQKLVCQYRQTPAFETAPPKSGGQAHLSRQFPQHAPFGIFATDRHLVAQSVNPALAQLFGYKDARELLHGCPDFLTVHCADATAKAELHSLASHPESVHEFEYQIVTRNGRKIWVSIHVWTLYDDTGRIVGFEGCFQNINYPKHADRLIKEQADFINRVSDIIIVTTPKGLISFWNRAAETTLGWTAAEVLGRKISELGQWADCSFATIENSLQTEKHWQGELNMKNKAGQGVVLETRFSALRDTADTPSAWLCLASDITTKLTLEKTALQAQRMEGIGMLATGIAHDLNNVLSPIILGVPMLREQITHPVAKQVLELMGGSAERGTRLVKQILSFSQRSESESATLEVTPIIKDISSLIRETFSKSIRYEESIAPSLWAIKGIPIQIHQVLLNLCVNARDAMENTGVLRLTVENRTLTEEYARSLNGAVAGDYVVFQINDSGPGISPENQKRIWKPFFTTKGPDHGTGIGLSTVKTIVEKHLGFITLDSTVGQGATFRIWIPASHKKQQPDVPASPAPERKGDGELILVVDDENSILEIAHFALTRNGYRVKTANNGAEAVQVFSEHHHAFSLIITDLSMPILDGCDLIKNVVKIHPHIKIITMSGSPKSVKMRQSLTDQQLIGHLSKPFSIATLLAEVHHILQPSSPAP